jgi:hypothetical protein
MPPTLPICLGHKFDLIRSSLRILPHNICSYATTTITSDLRSMNLSDISPRSHSGFVGLCLGLSFSHGSFLVFGGSLSFIYHITSRTVPGSNRTARIKHKNKKLIVTIPRSRCPSAPSRSRTTVESIVCIENHLNALISILGLLSPFILRSLSSERQHSAAQHKSYPTLSYLVPI